MRDGMMCNITPPGRRQRRSSRYTAARSRMCSSTLEEKMKSNDASRKGKRAASQTRRRTPPGSAEPPSASRARYESVVTNERQCGATSEAMKPSPPPISRPSPSAPGGTPSKTAANSRRRWRVRADGQGSRIRIGCSIAPARRRARDAIAPDRGQAAAWSRQRPWRQAPRARGPSPTGHARPSRPDRPAAESSPTPRCRRWSSSRCARCPCSRRSCRSRSPTDWRSSPASSGWAAHSRGATGRSSTCGSPAARPRPSL